jgi:glycosyltransferase involved in cell wall biosynthesis
MVREAQPAKVAFVSHHFRKNDGQGRVNYEVVKASLEQGYHVVVLGTSCADDLVSHQHCTFVQIGNDALPTELLRNMVFARGTARWLRKHRKELDLVLANGFVTWEACDVVAAHFVHAAWAKSKWYPPTTLSPYSLYRRLYTVLNTRWEKPAFVRARLVIAVSRVLVKELVDIGVPKDRIEVVWNGVDTDQFHPGEPNRHYFNLPPNVPIALFVGDLRTSRKNLDTVLEAMQLTPEIYLAVAGSLAGSPYPAMARKLGIEERVKFLDKVSDVPKLMRSVDMFVFPSRYEAHPLVLLEAMACGLPSVVSGTFGAEEFLGEGGVILADPNDAAALAAVMRDLADDSQKRAIMGAASRARALEMQWAVSTRGYLSAFERLLNRNFPQASAASMRDARITHR